MQKDKIITTTEELKAVLNQITFKNSVVDFKWQFEFREVEVKFGQDSTFFDANSNSIVQGDETRKGWLIWASFERPDVNNGEMGRGRGRDEIIWNGWSESAVVKTAWVIVEMLVRHELMEGIQYEDHRFFDPHNSVHELNELQINKGR